MTEKHIQQAICQYLVYAGFLVLRVNSGAAKGEYKGVKRFLRFVWWQVLGMERSSRGVADVLALKDGRLWAIEVKRPGKSASKDQVKFVTAVLERGGVGLVAHSVEEVQEAVEREEMFVQ